MLPPIVKSSGSFSKKLFFFFFKQPMFLLLAVLLTMLLVKHSCKYNSLKFCFLIAKTLAAGYTGVSCSARAAGFQNRSFYLYPAGYSNLLYSYPAFFFKKKKLQLLCILLPFFTFVHYYYSALLLLSSCPLDSRRTFIKTCSCPMDSCSTYGCK
jgi:hypothetical protein